MNPPVPRRVFLGSGARLGGFSCRSLGHEPGVSAGAEAALRGVLWSARGAEQINGKGRVIGLDHYYYILLFAAYVHIQIIYT